MKKNVWTKMLSLALALVCVIGLVACGGNDAGSSAAAGTYKLQTLDVGGLSMNVEELAQTAGVSEDEFKVVLDLKSDGTFTLDMAAVDESASMDGTWKESGSNITLTATVDGQTDTVTVTLEDDVITMSEEGMTMTFKK